MLERIFHLDEYGKQLKERASIHESQLKSQVNEILIKQEGLSHATNESVTQLENKIGQLQQTLLEKRMNISNFSSITRSFNTCGIRSWN
ncbi:hypothetical protein [Tepidibacillus marianensis]|uniref:hypothetical protein n=1 Tax=Tepidibacillus marianensis TaxID=3131995 RepID=UPI0030D59AD5